MAADSRRKSSPGVEFSKRVLSGACAGCIETLVTMPFEVTKTRLQIRHGAQESIFASMRSTWQSNGLRGFYFGLPVMLIQASGKLAIRFSVFEQFKELLSAPGQQPGKASVFVSGFAAGGIESAIWITPCERLKTLRQTQIGVPSAKVVHTAWHSSLQQVIKDEGIGSLFRGVIPTFWRNAGSVGYRFLVYDIAMEAIVGGTGEKRWFHSLLCGAFVGMTSTVLNNPLDVVKSRMQAEQQVDGGQYKYRGAIHCCQSIVREEGVVALGQGLFSRLCKITLGQAVIFFVYENIKQTVDQLY